MRKFRFMVSLSMFSLLIAAAPEANGAWNRNHGSYCWLDNENSGFFTSERESNFKVGAWDGDDWAVGGWMCPVKDTSDYPKGNIAEVNLHVWDGSSSHRTTAQACVTFAFSNGGECGVAVNSSIAGTGNVTLSITDLSAWDNANDFAFIRVLTGDDNLIKGYWTST